MHITLQVFTPRANTHPQRERGQCRTNRGSRPAVHPVSGPEPGWGPSEVPLSAAGVEHPFSLLLSPDPGRRAGKLLPAPVSDLTSLGLRVY